MASNGFKILRCSFYIFLSFCIADVKGISIIEHEETTKAVFQSSEIPSKTFEETGEERSTAVINTVVVNSAEPKLHIYPNQNPIAVAANLSFRLTCEGEAEEGEFTDMKWFNSDGEEIRNNVGKIESNQLYLEFPTPSVEDSGKYTCTAIFDKIEMLQAEVTVEVYDYDPCSNEPCMNGGSCSVTRDSFDCKCKEPFIGKYCEINLCPETLCKNGGICRPIRGEAECFCKEPYSGKYCDNRMDDCAINNICANGGICRRINYEMKCFCMDPYAGKYCTTDLRNNTTTYIVIYVLIGLIIISTTVVCILSCALCRKARRAKKN